MKHTISVFVSGAKRLKDHRMQLKVLANDMNGEFRKKGYNIILNMYSYMNLGDDQREYDDFIKHKSDIVLFIIEDIMGEKTRNEFLVASEAYKKSGSPKVYVFLKEFKQRTSEIQAIEDLVNSNSDFYYVEYTNIEDLVFKVRKRLQQDVLERVDKLNASPKKVVFKYKLWALVMTAACILMAAIGLYSRYHQSQSVILLFAGGGSATNCLKTNYKDVGDVYQYENAISIGLPTSISWSLISGEILHHHAKKSDRVQLPFFPICLSAKEAKESDFLKLTDRDQFVKKGSVLSLKIGYDCLKVYVKKSMDNELVNGRDTISSSDLAKLIRLSMDNGYEIFSTQEGSGTLLSYREILSPFNIDISKNSMGDTLQWFSQTTSSSIIRKKEAPYLILGSEYYVANEVFEEGDCRGIIIKNKEGKVEKKAIYLYFAGYYHGQEGQTFWIPDEMVDFLKKMNPKFGDVIKNNLIPRKNEMVIVPIDNLVNMNSGKDDE
ncbi:MAG: hypothetical protein K5893_05155 [Prevotella sp.]|nr:hypothetical protein [Prevotella sp.]